jgi:hypothetical protein
MTHDFKAALEDFLDGDGGQYSETNEAIIFALKLAEKVLGEPSEGMVRAAANHFLAVDGASFGGTYKVMTQTAVNEIT